MKILLTIILGGLFTLCFAPFHQFEVGFISLTGLLLVLDRVIAPKNIFWYGWLFGFIHHVTGLYWISYSMLVEADKYAWMIPFSASILPAYLAIYIGLACWLTYRLRFKIITKMLFFASIWTLMEIARGYLLTGFPWNLAGYTFLADEALSQAGSIGGVYGLSLIAIFLFTTPYLAVSYIKARPEMPFIYKASFSLCYMMPVIFVMVLLHNWGTQRIDNNKDRFQLTKVRIVQPNISQKEKFDSSKVAEQLFKFYNLSLQESILPSFAPDLIVWPEASTTMNLEDDKEFLAEVTNVIPYSSYLILGGIRYEGWMLNTKVYNSVEFISSDGVLQRMHYDKTHLVPFGEYVPFRNLLPGVDKLAQGIGDFNIGTGAKTLKLPNAGAFSPLICYEVIFPDQVVDRTSMTRPEWILNVTNDAWFGTSTGPYQHLDAVRMRAIEEGLPVIRSANTGISAVVDGLGRILQSAALNQDAILDTRLPAKLEEPTYFSQYGNFLPFIVCLSVAFISLLLKCISIILLRGQRQPH